MNDYETNNGGNGLIVGIIVIAAIILGAILLFGVFNNNDTAGDVFSDPELQVESDDGTVVEDDVFFDDNTGAQIDGNTNVGDDVFSDPELQIESDGEVQEDDVLFDDDVQ